LKKTNIRNIDTILCLGTILVKLQWNCFGEKSNIMRAFVSNKPNTLEDSKIKISPILKRRNHDSDLHFQIAVCVLCLGHTLIGDTYDSLTLLRVNESNEKQIHVKKAENNIMNDHGISYLDRYEMMMYIGRYIKLYLSSQRSNVFQNYICHVARKIEARMYALTLLSAEGRNVEAKSEYSRRSTFTRRVKVIVKMFVVKIMEQKNVKVATI